MSRKDIDTPLLKMGNCRRIFKKSSDVMSFALCEGHSGQEFTVPLSTLISNELPLTGPP